ncbi:hypothetical protein TrLO_g13214 [Triparma laevis f. longispina]|uniref:Uncharacterized protein n=1 Tax=Triparma laevis f. longispina TaxID=1714387 RepID=A0A9W7CL00_9STRA|nr:hypothetical protein TrLO_g13214 [Triparma laevis f. longispina]
MRCCEKGDPALHVCDPIAAAGSSTETSSAQQQQQSSVEFANGRTTHAAAAAAAEQPAEVYDYGTCVVTDVAAAADDCGGGRCGSPEDGSSAASYGYDASVGQMRRPEFQPQSPWT